MKKRPNTSVNQTGSGVHKDKRTKRNRAKPEQKRNAIVESQEQRDANTRVIKPSAETPYKGKKTNALQWNRSTP